MELRESEPLRESRCPGCGAPFALDAPEGYCIACLLRLGFKSEEDDEFAGLGFGSEVASDALDRAWPTLPNYQILRELGEGGSAVVYAARQLQPVRREVAVKVIKPGMDTRAVIARFASEKQALAVMDHPNIARVFDAGTTAGMNAGRAFFVMEQVAGVPITTYCDRKKLSVRERVALFIEVCNAVQHAHQKGIIHRDLKPANVLVAEHDGKPAPKVIDFGIAKATGDLRLSERTIFTAFEPSIGTPAYMSPEQADFGGTDIDTRSDIYSLGVMLYELLAGRTPFDSLSRAGLDELRKKIREEQPPRPSARAGALPESEQKSVAAARATEPAKLIRSLRGDLDWITMKTLEKDRARRYASAAGLAVELRRHLDAEPVTARPPSAFYQFQKLAQRHRSAFIAAALISAAILAAAVVSTWQAVLARRAEQRALTEARKSWQVAAMLEDMFQGVDPAAARGADTTLLRQILDKAAANVGENLKGSPEVEAHLRKTIGWSYHRIAEEAKAEAQLREAVRLYRTFAASETSVCTAMNWLAYIVLKRDPAEAEALGREAFAMQKRLAVTLRRDGQEARSLAGHNPALATVLASRKKANKDEALPVLREWLDYQKSVLGDDNPAVANTLNSLAGAEEATDDLAHAELHFRQALAIRQRIFGNDGLEVANTRVRLATVLMKSGDLEKAEPMLREGLATTRKFLGKSHPDLILPLLHLGDLLTRRGDLDEAEAILREALALSPKAPANRLTVLLRLGNALAYTFSECGEEDRAQALCRDFAPLANRAR